MSNVLFDAAGFLFTMLIGALVTPRFIRFLRKQIPVPTISEIQPTQAAWIELTTRGDVSGKWIGHLERILLFFALFLDAEEAATAIGVWLAFKVAAKWEAWNHMGYVPDAPAVGVDPLRFALARRIWAAQGYGTFVMGTGLNFIIAAVGVALAHCGRSWLGH
jgi:hypothetical protein